MIGFFIRWFTNTVALVIVVQLVPGIAANRWETVAVAALILGFLNAFLRPLLIFLTLPLQFVSLGFFTLIINGLMLYFVSKIVAGFYILSFGNAFWGALLFSIVSFLLNLFIAPDGRINIRFYRERSLRADREDEDIIDIEGKSDADADRNKRIRSE